MKKIGLIGGMSWESSQAYYQLINQMVREKLGGYHSAHCIMESVDFAEIERLQHLGQWGGLCKIMVGAASNLERAGADLVVLCTNTMHLCSAEIRRELNIPFLHIAEATGRKVREDGLRSVLLLGTRFTMESSFYRDILAEEFDLQAMTPDERDRETVHRIIYNELVHGKIVEESREHIKGIIGTYLKKGAQGVILGCTEIPLLIQQEDVEAPIYDTTRIHAEAAVEFALA